MRVKFKGRLVNTRNGNISWYNRIRGCIFVLSDIFKVNDWNVMRDEFNVQYDEINGKKRIIITRYEDENK
tara:strand:- start:1705 stop:1914 length:210 start_codon:yes stop_codon:yes gene_type:complete